MTTITLGARKTLRPKNIAKIRPMEVIDFIRRVLHDSPELVQMCERVDFSEGRPRRLRVDVLIAAAVAHAVTEESNIHVRGVAALLRALPVPDQRVLGVRWTDSNGGGEMLITERQVEYLFSRLASAFNTAQQLHDHMFALDEDAWLPTGEWVAPLSSFTDEEREVLACTPDCPRGVSMEAIGNMLLTRLWQQTGLPETDRWAVDSTVVETHFATKSWGAVANIDPDAVPDDARDLVELTPYPEQATLAARKPAGGKTPNKRTRKHAQTLAAKPAESQPRNPRSRKPKPIGPVAPGSKFTRYSAEFPQVGPDGRLAHTKDAGARNAYRGAGSNRPAGISNGRDKHGFVAAGPLPDGTPFPPITRAYRAVPGGDDKAQAFLTLLDYAEASGVQPAIVTADRIYSACKAETLQHLLDNAGWTLVRDLKDNQRRQRQWTTGVHYLDGWWFTSGMPDGLVELERAPQNVSSAIRLDYQEKFNARAAFAFRRNGNLHDGGFRLRGPAVPDSKTVDPLTGRPTSLRGVRVRCANSPWFRYLDRTLPKTDCVKGQPCGCSLTITIRANQVPNSCEPLLWGTTRWAKEYYRRNMSEASFSLEQYHYGLDRHSIRVRAEKWDLAFAIVALSSCVRQFHSFVMRLGAYTLDPGYHSAFDEDVYQPAIALVLQPKPTRRTAAPPG
ncbi:MAG: hypothetical protein ACKOAF_02260 [Actinomycetes bacterium]